jgi:hypothetical protein
MAITPNSMMSRDDVSGDDDLHDAMRIAMVLLLLIIVAIRTDFMPLTP